MTAIHVFAPLMRKGLAARLKPGHDEGTERDNKKGGFEPPFLHPEAQAFRYAAREEPPAFL